ncbi:MAG: ABC transporter ATP-binding protein, partial [Clostridiales bacterium]|nr:ABC transporter ATP-binding protein [Candidatus Blautia equi]
MNEKEEKVSLPFFGVPKIIPFVKPYRKTILLMVSFGFFSSLVDSIYPLFNRYALNHYVAEQTLDTLPWFIGIYLTILIVQVISNYYS